MKGREGGGAAEGEECEKGVERVEGYLETRERWGRRIRCPWVARHGGGGV